ncbi:MAG: methylase, partial [Spirochaetaceae bacterium]|nr:methylase [Spirochaetaceae bacterium]
VIIGFSQIERKEKQIFHYTDVSAEPAGTTANKINAYLIDTDMVFIENRKKPLCPAPEMVFGSMPNDGGYFLLSSEEKDNLINTNSAINNFIRPFVGADEFLYNTRRYCIWLKDVAPSKYSGIKEIKKRIQSVKEHRERSTRENTRKLAAFPSIFGEIRQPETDYLLIPRHSSGNRKYIPIGFIDKNTIAGDSNIIIPNATLYEFGVITSLMHMVWTKRIAGYLGTSIRYSASMVYNNFPWPNPADKQKEKIESAARKVLDARLKFRDDSLADLYDPLTMHSELVKAHQKLDKAVDAAYGRTFANDSERVAYLFELYQKLSGELFRDEKKRGKGKKDRGAR